jgi:hypothetical protein
MRPSHNSNSINCREGNGRFANRPYEEGIRIRDGGLFFRDMRISKPTSIVGYLFSLRVR